MRYIFLTMVITIFLSVSAFSQKTTAGESYSKANALSAEGNYSKASELFEKALHQVSNSDKETGRDLKADILLGIGIAQFNLGELKIAEKSLKKSGSQRKGKHANTLYYLGLVELKRDETTAAQSLFTQAIGADSGHAEAWYELGVMLLKQGRHERANLAFGEAVKNGTTRMKEAKAALESSSKPNGG